MELIGTIAVVVSVLVLAYQGRELAGHTRIANEVAGTQAHRELLFHWKSVIDVFVRHPELHGLYFGSASRTPNAEDDVRLDVIAEQHADWLDTTLMTETQLGPYLYREWIGGWHEFAVKSVADSPALRSLIRRRPMEWPMLDPLVAAYEAEHPAEVSPQDGS
jgi:hypothetical protein